MRNGHLLNQNQDLYKYFLQYSDVSRTSEISLSAYLRTAPSVPGQERADMGNDLFLAGVKFLPSFDSVSKL